MIYTDKDLASNFSKIYITKDLKLKERVTGKELLRIKYNQLEILMKALNQIKPQSQQTKYKRLLIEYMDELIQSNGTLKENLDFVHLRKEKLWPIGKHLEKYGYEEAGVWKPISIGILIVELIIISLSKLYLIPIVTILYSVYSIFKEIKLAKKEKLLNII